MRAVDTNVVIRYLTGDDQVQAVKAKAVFDAGGIFISTTVLLETEWVLRSGYGFKADEISTALRALAGLPDIHLESPSLLHEALDRVANGMDFADALHLGAASQCEALLTFDRRFIAAAAMDPSASVTEPG